MSTTKPREFALRRWPNSDGDYIATPIHHILYRHPDTIIVREVLPGDPDLAPGIRKAIEICKEIEFRAHVDRVPQPGAMSVRVLLEAEAKRLGLLKGDE